MNGRRGAGGDHSPRWRFGPHGGGSPDARAPGPRAGLVPLELAQERERAKAKLTRGLIGTEKQRSG